MDYKQKKLLRIIVLTLGEAACLALIAAGILQETRKINQTVIEVSDLRDPSPFRAALMGHLGKISLGVKGHLSTPDPAFEKQVDESRKDFESALPDFVKQNPKLFPQIAAEEIQRTFGQFKEALLRTFDNNTRRKESRTRISDNFAQILQLIEHRIRPLIRKDQADGEERSEAILNIENQARAWQDNLTRAWAETTDATKAAANENDNRGQTHMDRYARLELLSRERKVFKDMRALWLANSDLARESFVKENLVSQSAKVMDGERLALVSVLNQYLPAMPPAELDAKKQHMLGSIKLHLGLSFLLGMLGLVSIVVATLWGYRLSRVSAPPSDGIFRMPVHQGTPKAEGGPSPTLQMDLQGKITAWSPEAEQLYGYPASETLGLSIGMLFESESEIGRLGQALHKAKDVKFETIHKNKEGVSILVRIEFCPVTDATEHTTAIGLICTAR